MDQINPPTNTNMPIRTNQIPGGGGYNDPRVMVPNLRNNYPMMSPYIGGYPEQV